MTMTNQQLIDLIDTKIETLVTTQEVDYTEGDVSVKKGQKMEQLIKLRASLLRQPDAAVDFIAIDYDISDFGIDLSQYIK